MTLAVPRLQARLAGLSPWHRRLAALLLGAAAALAFAPFDAFPVLFVAFTGLFWLLDSAPGTRAAFGVGWWFGWGHFMAGLYWIGSAFLVEPDKFAWMVPAPVLGLPAVLALFPAIGCALAFRLSRSGPERLGMLAVCWVAAEYARAHVLTGFPWNLVAHSLAVSDATMQPAAWIGTFGLGVVVVAAAAAPGLLAAPRPGHRRAAAVPLLLLVAICLAGWVRLSGIDTAAEGPRIRVVQPDIAQRDKWRRDLLGSNFALQLDLSRDRPGAPSADVVVWSETATVWSIEDTPTVRDALAGIARGLSDGRGGVLVTGVPRVVRDGESTSYRNSARAVGPDGAILATYDKVHLVPFGEYLPARPLLQAVGLERLAQGRGDFLPGADNQVFDVPGLPPAGVMICYEAIFPARAAPAPRPAWLLNLTNDGWFGKLSGPYQHFVTARFRAVEQGLPLVRAAGTGISAITDGAGRIVASLPLGQAGVIAARLPTALPPTIYSRWGEWPAVILMLATVLFLRIGRLFR